MISRRGMLGAALLPAAAALSGCTTVRLAPPAPAQPRLTLRGSLRQGSLVVGTAVAASRILWGQRVLRPDPAGRFAFALAWKDTDEQTLQVQYVDGTAEARAIKPLIQAYDIQHIDGLPEDKVTPDPVLIARITKENAAIIAARLTDSEEEGFAQAFEWPAHGPVSGVFGSQRILNGQPRAPHFGVDVAVPTGTPIHAPASGVVRFAETGLFLTGGTTVIDHGHGVSTTYFHQSAIGVAVGQSVATGDVIGAVGATGRATGPHLHWAMNWFEQRLDPSLSTVTPKPPLV
ncbi:MAG: M23 family metallopeptidase [Rhizomicrobium sp.]